MYDHSRRTLTIASLATLATFLDTTILYVAFPDITATFSDTGASELSWVLNAYTIVFAALLIPAGKLADRVGHRRVFLAGSTVFTVASMACGLAPTAELLIVFRIVQAVGAAALIPSSLALVMHAFAHDQLPRAVAIWGAAGAVAGALGPTLGAAIVEGLGWRWAFFINLPVGIYTVIAGRRNLHESSDPETRVPSLVGVVLIAGAAGLLSYGVVGSEDVGWLSARTLGVLGAGLRRARRLRRPPAAHRGAGARPRPVPHRQLRVGQPRHAGVRDRVRRAVLRLDPVPHPGLGVVGPPGRLRCRARPGRSSASSHPGPASSPARIGQRPILIAGGVLYASSGLYRLVMLGPDVNYLRDYFPSMVLSGLGVACVFPQLSSVVAQALPPNRTGVGGAALQAVRQFGGTFGVALTIAFLGTHRAAARSSPSTGSGGSSSPADSSPLRSRSRPGRRSSSGSNSRRLHTRRPKPPSESDLRACYRLSTTPQP